MGEAGLAVSWLSDEWPGTAGYSESNIEDHIASHGESLTDAVRVEVERTLEVEGAKSPPTRRALPPTKRSIVDSASLDDLAARRTAMKGGGFGGGGGVEGFGAAAARKDGDSSRGHRKKKQKGKKKR